MIEHRPSRGDDYEKGIQGQRIAIVGYSHHRQKEVADHAGFTQSVMKRVLKGEKIGDSLFPTIPRYFDYTDRVAFWKSVLFFNFIPCCIGETEDKYKSATKEMVTIAQQRFGKILEKEKPNKVFVFTTKGWASCPNTIQEDAEIRCTPLGANYPNIAWGEYEFGGHKAMAFGFRHPQFATKLNMHAAVLEALSR